MEINSVFIDKGFQLYYQIFNSQGKIWHIPGKNCSIGFNIYQPSSFKGSLLKVLFPLIRRVSFFRKLLGITFHAYNINPSLISLLSNLFQTDGFQLAAFSGTPSKHQKLTLQVSSGRRILGYCKISAKDEIVGIFRHEELILNDLRIKGITEIPYCIFNGNFSEGTNIFVQTTRKTPHSRVLHKLTSRHWEFLQKLYLKTKVNVTFEETDFFLSLSSLRDFKFMLNPREIDIILSAIEKIEDAYSAKLVEFSIYHADFTPWNMFVENGKLFVFDWEYSLKTVPPFIDAFHFFTQVNIFEHHLNAERIYKKYKKEPIFRQYFTDPDFYYLCYLLVVISQYLKREKGQISGSVRQSVDVWIQLISRFISTEKSGEY